MENARRGREFRPSGPKSWRTACHEGGRGRGNGASDPPGIPPAGGHAFHMEGWRRRPAHRGRGSPFAGPPAGATPASMAGRRERAAARCRPFRGMHGAVWGGARCRVARAGRRAVPPACRVRCTFRRGREHGGERVAAASDARVARHGRARRGTPARRRRRAACGVRHHRPPYPDGWEMCHSVRVKKTQKPTRAVSGITRFQSMSWRGAPPGTARGPPAYPVVANALERQQARGAWPRHPPAGPPASGPGATALRAEDESGGVGRACGRRGLWRLH